MMGAIGARDVCNEGVKKIDAIFAEYGFKTVAGKRYDAACPLFHRRDVDRHMASGMRRRFPRASRNDCGPKGAL